MILSLNGREVTDSRDLSRRVGMMKPGETVSLRVMRDGHERTVEVKLGAQARQQVAAAEHNQAEDTAGSVLGVQIAPASQVRGAGDEGVVIVGVDPDGQAAAKGLSDGDVILEVSGRAVSKPADIRAGLDEAKHDGRKVVLMKVKTAQGPRFVAFAFPKA